MLKKSLLKNDNKFDLSAMLLIIAGLFIYTLPLLLNMGKAVLLTNKNCINSWYSTYNLGIYPYFCFLADKSLPYWSAFREGGFYWLSYPSELSCNLLSLLILGFDLIKGLNLSWYMLYFVGGLSMFYLARKVFRFELFGATYAAIVFSMSGFFAYMQGLGLWTRETLLLPLLAIFVCKALKDNKFIIFAAIVLAQFVHAMLFFPVISLFLFISANVHSFTFEQGKLRFEKRYLVVFFSVLILSLLFSAYKLLPILEFIRIDPRSSGFDYMSSIEQANTMSLFLRRLLNSENLNVGTMYLGIMPVVLCLLSGIFMFKKLKKWIFVLVLFIVLSFGPNAYLDLHRILWPLPGFNSMREISKYYALIIVFLISLLSGRFFTLLKQSFLRKMAKAVSIVIILITFVNLLFSNIGYFNIFGADLNITEPKPYSAHVKAINIHKGNEGPAEPLRLALYLNGFGLFNAQYHHFVKYFKDQYVNPRYFIMPEYVFLSMSTKMFVLENPGYRGETFFLKKQNIAKEFSITSNSINLKVEVKEPDILVINQRYGKGWVSEFGKIENYNGLLAIKLENPGEYDMRLYFVPLSFYLGLLVSLLSFIFALKSLLLLCRKRVRDDEV